MLLLFAFCFVCRFVVVFVCVVFDDFNKGPPSELFTLARLTQEDERENLNAKNGWGKFTSHS